MRRTPGRSDSWDVLTDDHVVRVVRSEHRADVYRTR
jgi:hypothetical protein